MLIGTYQMVQQTQKKLLTKAKFTLTFLDKTL